LNADAAFAGVDEGANDGHAFRVRESLDGVVLVLRGVLLVVRGHAHVLRCLDETARVVRGMRIARHEKNHPGQEREADHKIGHMIVSSRTFLRGHSPLYNGGGGMPNEMFFTASRHR
jgi:hypothetical protein